MQCSIFSAPAGTFLCAIALHLALSARCRNYLRVFRFLFGVFWPRDSSSALASCLHLPVPTLQKEGLSFPFLSFLPLALRNTYAHIVCVIGQRPHTSFFSLPENANLKELLPETHHGDKDNCRKGIKQIAAAWMVAWLKLQQSARCLFLPFHTMTARSIADEDEEGVDNQFYHQATSTQ